MTAERNVTRRKNPLRWRKRKQEYGERGNAMTNFIWYRDNGRDVELTRGGMVLARVKPDGRWEGMVGDAASQGIEATTEFAKAEAERWVRDQLRGQS